MSKILLVFESYTEMVQLETQLKKVGFDTVGIGSEMSLANQIVELNPSVIIAYGQGSRVNTLSVARRLKEMVRWTGKVILIFPETMKPSAEDLIKIRMDLLLEAPPKVERILQVIAKLLDLDEIQLLEKLKNLGLPYLNDNQAFFKAQLHSNEHVQGESRSKESDMVFIQAQIDKDQAAFVTQQFESGYSETDLFKDSKKNELNSDQEKKSGIKNDTGDLASQNDMKFILQNEAAPAKSKSIVQGESEDISKLKTLDGAKDAASQILEFLSKQDSKPHVLGGASTDLPVMDQQEGIVRIETLVTPEVLFKVDKTATRIDENNRISRPPGERDIALETQQALADGQSRISKYKNFLINLTFQPQSTVSRKLTRRIQQEIMQGINAVEVENQDERRREFTRALFQKQK
ncbi:MAG: hypothetical protein ACK5WZ_12410 [Pseudobdellovibrionaceae bacterium]